MGTPSRRHSILRSSVHAFFTTASLPHARDTRRRWNMVRAGGRRNTKVLLDCPRAQFLILSSFPTTFHHFLQYPNPALSITRVPLEFKYFFLLGGDGIMVFLFLFSGYLLKEHSNNLWRYR